MSTSQTKESHRGISPYLLVAGLTLACLLPFIGKGFHVDDPLFLWSAEQIREHPLDFFGFEKTWDQETKPMHDINKNPPGISYFIALSSLIVGWREAGLHLFFILPNVATSLGIYHLARRYTPDAVLATAIAILTPAFLVTATGVMCEPLMLPLYIWSIVLWMKGLESGDRRFLIAAGVAIGASIFVKYIAVTAIPLLVAYTVLRERRVGKHLMYFLIPLGIAGGYDIISFVLYDKSILLSAADYAFAGAGKTTTDVSGLTIFTAKFLVTVSFVGGCFSSVLFFVPWMWNARTLGAFAALFVLIFLFLISPFATDIIAFAFGGADITTWRLCQLALWASAGFHLLYLSAHDMNSNRNSETAILFLLVLGMFTFSAFINWTINARTLLPMLPAVGILVARRLEGADDALVRGIPVQWALAPALALTLLVTHADYSFARSDRQASRDIVDRLEGSPGTLYYYGDWGFAWYMGRAGYPHLKLERLPQIPAPVQRMLDQNPGLHIGGTFQVSEGDVLVFSNSEDQLDFAPEKAELLFTLLYAQNPVAVTLSGAEGAGFYSYTVGPLPFYLGKTSPREYKAYRFKQDFNGLMLMR